MLANGHASIFCRVATLVLAALLCGPAQAGGLGPIGRMPSRAAPDTPVASHELSSDAIRSVESPIDVLLPPMTVSEEFAKALRSPVEGPAGIGRSPNDLGVEALRQLAESTRSVAFRVFSPGAKHLRTGLLLPASGSYQVIAYAPGHEQEATVVNRSADSDKQQ